MRTPFQVLVIPFRRAAGGPEYAVLKRSDAGYWQFVAGGGEGEETPAQAARREAHEEIGVDGAMVQLDSCSTVPRNCFAAAASWGPDVYVVPEHCFAVEVGHSDLVLSGEHTELRWVVYDVAAGLLQWDSNRSALWELHERLKRETGNDSRRRGVPATTTAPAGVLSEANDARIRIVDLDAYEPSDAEILSWHQMMTAPDQLAWEYDATWAAEPTTPQEEIDAFRTRRQEQRGRNHPLWAMCDGKVVGMIGINRYQELCRRHCAELGYGVAAAFTRRGIATRLIAAAVQKARLLGLRRLEANCLDTNVASIGLLRRCGFREEGLRLGAICKDGQLLSERLFAFEL